MVRIITKELAERIVKKLRAARISSKSKAHDLYSVEIEGIIVTTISIRRGSEKDKGHDYISRDLFLSPSQAKRLGQCPLSREEYVAILREKGHLPARDEEPGEDDEPE